MFSMPVPPPYEPKRLTVAARAPSLCVLTNEFSRISASSRSRCSPVSLLLSSSRQGGGGQGRAGWSGAGRGGVRGSCALLLAAVVAAAVCRPALLAARLRPLQLAVAPSVACLTSKSLLQL